MRKKESSNVPSSPKDNSTFIISLILVLAIVAWGIISSSSFEAVGTAAFDFITGKFGWFYVLSVSVFVLFTAWMGFASPYRNMRLGPDDSRPEYSNISWFGMLFSAGMGIGLVFWGVAEPLSFWATPPGFEPGSTEAAAFAFRKAFLHWGLHPWACFTVLGLSLAYFQFRKGSSGLISSVFVPLIGQDRVNGPIGKLIDILAVFATAAGIATSLGLGALQINGGLSYVFGLPNNNLSVSVIVIVITVIYVWTAVAGVDKGIKKVCDLNILLAAVAIVFSFLVGPTVDILKTLVASLGDYIMTFFGSSNETGAFGNTDWYSAWTVFYWAWWIAWAPFCALFIARISKGRTIKEFVAGVLLLPAGASFVWFAVFGTCAITAGNSMGLETATQVASDPTTALFIVMESFPLGQVVSVIIIVLLCTFFITSANSATYVLGMLSSNGNLNPPNNRKFLWGILQAALALVIMVSTENGLNMLQTVSIVGAFPFAFVLIISMFSLLKALKAERVAKATSEAVAPPAVEEPKA